MEAAKKLNTYSKLAHDSIVWFVTHVIGVTPTHQQLDVLDAIDKGNWRISIRSGHGPGKSTLMAWIALWWLSTRPHSKVPCTAPTGHQLQDVLWGEISYWHGKMAEPWKGCIEITSDMARHVIAPKSWYAAARTARKENPDALQGFHADHLAFLIDEASGVPEEIFQVAEGALSTPGVLVVMAGNPTRLEGSFYESFHNDRKHWSTFHFSSKDSPLVDKAYWTRMAERYGEDSDIYRVRVLGDFPRQETDALISLEMVEDAQNRTRPDGWERFPLVYGVDPARFGDDETALVKRRGSVVTEVMGVHKRDTMEVAGLVALEAKKDRPKHIFVDTIGVGSGVFDRLVELGYPVVEVNVAEKAKDTEQFNDSRSELWWNVKEWIEKEAAVLPDDDDLAGQLSTVKFRITSSGKVRIEGKDERKKRGLSSPDRADALMLTFSPKRTKDLSDIQIGEPTGGGWMS
jgi:hypothetical protein